MIYLILNLILLAASIAFWCLSRESVKIAEQHHEEMDRSVSAVCSAVKDYDKERRQQKEETERVLMLIRPFIETFDGTLDELALKLEKEFTGKPIGMLCTAFLAQRDMLAENKQA